jgi:predicted transcriptional regulator
VSVFQITNFPDDLHHRLRVLAAKRRESQREIAIEAIRETVERLEREEDS